MEDITDVAFHAAGAPEVVLDIHERGQAGTIAVSGSLAEEVKLVLTRVDDQPRTAKAIADEIERLKVELRGAKAREKEQMTGEGKAALEREKGAKEELARARKIGFNPEGPLHSEASVAADVAALVAAGWDREQGTWRRGDRLLFLSRTGWVAGRVGTRDWKPVVSVTCCVAEGGEWEGP